ncbi:MULTISPECIES: hypothetical protein [Halobacteriovorax]|uniref:DUF4834 domain-containing protein n=1 Tax=Halobacteriovorax vibrionivorans TaxID=2152716 RepID=A0ABY0IEP8_9BACT|nr:MULTISPECIES: hypothetical protein [Halobacteriovorax]AYF44511.1 hypothetical protein BALOs_1510 [Halobacteriovorax sp. BALOs_7]RZF20568.1 hypothetical protein DAY19_11320 [Halobacteriovorax vibrionivorans]TGD47481.1 hypothetical protein EP118_07850 [Halobacteriovorax sp. Y22]
MFAALVKAAIFYWVFIMIRRLLRSSGVLADKKPKANPFSTNHSQRQRPQGQFKDEDVIEADYRVID